MAKANDAKTFEQLQALGVKLIPLKAPEWALDVSSYGVESAVFFDELIRAGRDKQLTNPGRANGWRSSRLIPAVEYLQLLRARSMMMMKLAEATADVDVYLAPANAGGGGGGRGAPGAGAPPTDGAAPAGGRGASGRGGRGGGFGGARSATQRHFNMANLACYPALAAPNGFYESGSPATIAFYGRPFNEGEILALGKAYQDAAGFHLKHPKLKA